jgi:hypothetical protein
MRIFRDVLVKIKGKKTLVEVGINAGSKTDTVFYCNYPLSEITEVRRQMMGDNFEWIPYSEKALVEQVRTQFRLACNRYYKNEE